MRVLPPTPRSIDEAARALIRGEIVVIPTETVYGLAASIERPDAVRRVFEIKRRPLENPLIVHIAELSRLNDLVVDLPNSAQILIDRFWPGPLTVVFRKTSLVPTEVTGGGPTVAIRMPAHQVALDLIRKCGSPLAAPSANRFTELSPTTVQDISPEMSEYLDIVLDGGPCVVGIESTVVDCTEDFPQILRPGQISSQQIEALIGPLSSGKSKNLRSPGQYVRHYAPSTPVRIVALLGSEDAGLTFKEPLNHLQVKVPSDPGGYAATLYHNLHRLDAYKVPELLVQAPPRTSEWSGIWDRLTRASSEPVP